MGRLNQPLSLALCSRHISDHLGHRNSQPGVSARGKAGYNRAFEFTVLNLHRVVHCVDAYCSVAVLGFVQVSQAVDDQGSGSFCPQDSSGQSGIQEVHAVPYPVGNGQSIQTQRIDKQGLHFLVSRGALANLVVFERGFQAVQDLSKPRDGGCKRHEKQLLLTLAQQLGFLRLSLDKVGHSITRAVCGSGQVVRAFGYSVHGVTNDSGCNDPAPIGDVAPICGKKLTRHSHVTSPGPFEWLDRAPVTRLPQLEAA